MILVRTEDGNLHRFPHAAGWTWEVHYRSAMFIVTKTTAAAGESESWMVPVARIISVRTVYPDPPEGK